MNSFFIFFVPLEEVFHMVAKEQDKTRVFSTYVPKIKLNIENPKISKSKIQFLEIRKSLRTNPTLYVIIPPRDSNSAHEFGQRMEIIGENNQSYATIDHYNFNNISNQFESIEVEDEVRKLDRIPYYAQSNQQVLSNKNKLKYFLTHNASLMLINNRMTPTMCHTIIMALLAWIKLRQSLIQKPIWRTCNHQNMDLIMEMMIDRLL